MQPQNGTGPERGLTFSGAIPLRLGIRFPSALAYREWIEIGRRVGVHADASLWWRGDWLNFGKHTYGHRYKRGIELTGLDYQTLRNDAMVSRRFEMSRRRDKLSFHHHAEVCALGNDEQDRWLDHAEAGRWTRNELRRRLRAERQRTGSDLPETLRLPLDPERAAQWLSAADVAGVGLSAWIVATLDTAALQLLS